MDEPPPTASRKKRSGPSKSTRSRRLPPSSRRAEQRDRNARYYALHPTDPARLTGGRADFVDDDGRRYRRASDDDEDARQAALAGLVALDVAEVPGRLALDQVRRPGGELKLMAAGSMTDIALYGNVTIARFGIREPRRRKWRIYVHPLPPLVQ